MGYSRVLACVVTGMLASGASSLAAQVMGSSAGALKITKMADGFDIPWGFGFLPDGSVLITDREGLLYLVRDGAKTSVSGVPEVAAVGQGGLLDVLVPRDIATSGEILLTLSRQDNRGAGTALVSATLSPDFTEITQSKVLLQVRGTDGGRHFGSRVREAKDGSLYLTSGERGDRDSAQDLSNRQGAILRVNRDGSPHANNPFIGQAGVMPEIWSYGHRNPQGLAIDRTGQVWAVEHGARGGDEINKIEKGANYGWPVIAYGRNYSGTKIGIGTAKDGLEQPAFFWDPSIAPSGMMIYSGKLWPAWRGDMFIGSLKFDYIARLDGTPKSEQEQLRHETTGRIRDIREAPDGSIWFASEYEGALFRLTPAP
ncbi:PQQ-dependent sugar dehydrogenase [Epibacterium ulvae]|uniref:PQQ-dependent sugar dehydrogenase n=1 Tax=Epibacterium ulvae TaxID=1156985 RepID=UPI001BFC400E|nr:PQQ-dependent sugar dehydrogenase [Epibacterium ulvae]MBT8154463.1 PQQ-dependent sugar dehydrogenase [Epibacterium ulvae]